jgi:tRNA pseudouridine38-40 synthase
MPRYFIEVSYLGNSLAGFQIQDNAKTVQGELEKAFFVIFRKKISLTGSSRTDAGVHAIQNFFHFDEEKTLDSTIRYNLNAILPNSISVVSIRCVLPNAHVRFDATAREYQYNLHFQKNPFLADRSLYYPYPLDIDLLNMAASLLLSNDDFSSFSKKGSQAKTTLCKLEFSQWISMNEGLRYSVKGNRFLRGMVRGMVGTMLKVGRGKMSIIDFEEIILKHDRNNADFSVSGHGLTLVKVFFPPGLYM